MIELKRSNKSLVRRDKDTLTAIEISENTNFNGAKYTSDTVTNIRVFWKILRSGYFIRKCFISINNEISKM